MSRPADFSPLAAADPVPGDPHDVLTLAGGLADTAAELQRQAARLRAAAADDRWRGESAAAFQRTAAGLADRLGAAQERYTAAAASLRSYAPHLEDAQHRSLELLRRAHEAEDRARAARSALTSLAGDPPAPADDDPSALARHDAAVAERAAGRARSAGALADAQSELRALRARLHEVCAERDDAAEHAARAIGTAIDGDALRDSWRDELGSAWSGFTGWVHEHREAVGDFADRAGAVAAGLGLLAAVLASTGVLAPVGAALGVVATLASAAALAAHLALFAAGDGDWKDLAWDVAGLATGGVARLARYGAGAATALVAARGSSVARLTAAQDRLARAVVDAGGPALSREATSALARRLSGPWSGDLKRELRDELNALAGAGAVSGNRVKALRDLARQEWTDEVAAAAERLGPGAARTALAGAGRGADALVDRLERAPAVVRHALGDVPAELRRARRELAASVGALPAGTADHVAVRSAAGAGHLAVGASVVYSTVNTVKGGVDALKTVAETVSRRDDEARGDRVHGDRVRGDRVHGGAARRPEPVGAGR